MPTWFAVILVLFFSTMIAASITGIFYIAREVWEEKQVPVTGWDNEPATLRLWRVEERQQQRKPCPGCSGFRCWDWTRNGRSCKKNPTRADDQPNRLIAKHYAHTVEKAPTGWWPLPRNHRARVRPDLWRKVAGHCQIALVRPRTAWMLP